MSSKCLELTQQVIPTVYDVTPKPEYGEVLEVDMKNGMIGEGNLFAAKMKKFNQRIADTSEYLNRANKCVITTEVQLAVNFADLKGLTEL